jgi:hypothetical protein
MLDALLRIWDPVLFYPWIRDGKKSGSRIRDEHPSSVFRELRNSILRVENTSIP